MKAFHLYALASILALASCRSASTSASTAFAGRDPAPSLAEDPGQDASDSLAVELSTQDQASTAPNELDEWAAADEPGRWEFAIRPYRFFAGANGTIGVSDSSNDLDADFGDLFGSLDFGALVALEVGHTDSSWKGLVDLTYLRLEEDGTSSAGNPAEAEMDQLVAEFAAVLELQPDGLVDLLFGLRAWSLSAEVSEQFPPPTGTQTADGSQSWVDPIIGLRSRLPLSPTFDVVLRGDVGGFGAGSEFSSQLAAGLDWSFAESFALGAGFRQIYVNYEDSDFLYDVKFGGPFLGLTWRF